MAFDIRTYLPGLVIFVGIMMAGTFMLVELGRTDETFIIESPAYGIFNSLNYYDDLASQTQALNNSFYSANSSSVSNLGGIGGLVTDSFTLLKKLPSLIFLPISSFYALSSLLGLPIWLPNLVVIMLSLSFLIFILLAIFRAWGVSQ